MTWKLWQALKRPPTHHHLFRRFYIATEEPFPWYVGCSRYVAMFFVLPILTAAGLFYGIGWAVGIANLIGKEKERGAFDLISLSPSGSLGVSWAMSLGYLYHHVTFRNINHPGNLLMRLGLSALFLFTLNTFFYIAMDRPDANPLTLLLSPLVIVVALYLDHVQSLVLVPLVGIGSGLLANNRLNGQLYAFAGYIGCQLATYLTTLLIGFIIVPGILRAFSLRGDLVGLLLLLGQLALFYSVREAIIALLWRRLTTRLTTDPLDIDRIAGRKFSLSSLW